MRAAIGLWARREVSRRWKALVALGVLAGVVAGLALAAVAGARRTETAYERFREATGRSDAIVFASLVGLTADYTAVRELPEVLDAGEFSLTPIGIEDPPMGQLAPNDDRLYRTINRPLLVAGRLPDPGREHEILVNRNAARQHHLGVGDRLTIVSSTELDAFDSTQAPEGGPSVEATVVGIGDSNIDLGFLEDEPAFVPSAALLASHPEIPRIGNLVVRLRPGTHVDEFSRRVADALGVPDVPVRDQAEDAKRITNGTDLERTALLLFAGAVALAGLVLVGQALARTVYGIAEPTSALRTLGFTRRGLVGGLVLPLVITAAIGAITTFAVAVTLSPRFPVGLAASVEPDRGAHVDWLVLGPGIAAFVVVAFVGATLSAVRATSPRRGPYALRAGSSRVRALGRVAPLPAVIGAGLALERGEGDRALPVRPALASAVGAVLGVVGAFGLLHGIDGALTRPERSGQFWDADVLAEEKRAEVLAALEGDEQVREITGLRIIGLDIGGASVPAYSLSPVKGTRSFTVIEGRGVGGPDEVVLGPATARALARDVGDMVRIGGTGGRDVRIVGLGLLPQTPHFSFDQGAWISSRAPEAAAPDTDEATPREDTILVRFAPGQEVGAAVAGLSERLGADVEIEPSSLPQDVAYLRNVRTLPKALAAFLVLLGLAALGHVLVTAVRRRRHDLAVLRAIGFRPVQVASCVVWQSVTVAVVALVIGIPLGIAAGRWSWRWVADATPLLYVPPLAALAIVVAVPAALVLANAMAALPARRAARLRPADVLRAE